MGGILGCKSRMFENVFKNDRTKHGKFKKKKISSRTQKDRPPFDVPVSRSPASQWYYDVIQWTPPLCATVGSIFIFTIRLGQQLTDAKAPFFSERHFLLLPIPSMDSRVRNYQGDHNITITSDSTLDADGPYYSQSYSSANDKNDSFRQRRRDVNRHNGQYKLDNEDLGLGIDYDNSYLKAARKRTALEDQSRKRDLKIALALTLWACYIRLWKIWQPSSVV
jgi:hypothetical protein